MEGDDRRLLHRGIPDEPIAVLVVQSNRRAQSLDVFACRRGTIA
jgi:hypothetical protein